MYHLSCVEIVVCNCFKFRQGKNAVTVGSITECVYLCNKQNILKIVQIEKIRRIQTNCQKN